MLELLALLMQQCLFFLGYITGRSEFPPALNRAEEAELIGKLDAGDHNARQELITHNLRLVSHIARKYQIPGYGADDLISIGVIGLIKAVDSFKSASGTPLGTYAARCIENEILMTLRASRKRRGDVRREWAFNLRLKGQQALLLQGVIDCAFEENGAWVLVDYKTDRVDDEQTLVNRYAEQLTWYARALTEITGKPVKERYLFALRVGKAIAVPEIDAK